MTSPIASKHYFTVSTGQVHCRIWEPEGEASQPDLYCLHPSPFSGLAFAMLAPLLATTRRVIAPDYPGYGGSDPLAEPATIAAYAASMQSLARDCGDGAPVDVLGFHTGCLVAAEWALQAPSSVRRACLIDIPAFGEAQSAKMAESFAGPVVIGPELATLESVWAKAYTARRETQGDDLALAMFAEQLRAGRGGNAAFHAAFTYDWTERLPQLSVPTLAFASQSGLLDATRTAAEIIPGARLVERLDITRSVLDEAAEKTASEVLTFLAE